MATRLPRLVEMVLKGECRVYVEPPYTSYVVAFARALAGRGVAVLASPTVAAHIDGARACGERVEGLRVAVLWCPPPSGLDVVFAAGVRVKGLKRLSVYQLGEGRYIAKGCGVTEFHCVSAGVIEVCELKLDPALETAYSELRAAYLEHGPLRLSDAVTVVSAALGVKRGDARRIILELARYRLVKLVEGYVVVP